MAGWGCDNAAWDGFENATDQTDSGNDSANGWGVPIPPSAMAPPTQQPKAPAPYKAAPVSTTAPVQKPPPLVSMPKAPYSVPPPKIVPTTTAPPMPVKTQPTENKNNVETGSAVQISNERDLLVLSNLNGQASLSLDVLRMLVNHYAQDPGGKSFQDHVSKILFTSGEDIAFVQMATAEAAQRVQNGLNGAICFEKEVFSAIAPVQIQFVAEGGAPIAVKQTTQPPPAAIQTLPTQTAQTVTYQQKSEQQPTKQVVQTNNSWANNNAVVNGVNGPEQQKQSSTTTGWGASTDNGASTGQNNDPWGSANGGNQQEQNQPTAKANDDPWGRSSKVWDEEPDGWGKLPKSNNANKTANPDQQADKPPAENGHQQWGGGEKRQGGGGRSNYQSNDRNGPPSFNSNRFDNRSRDGGGNIGGGRGRGSDGAFNSRFQQRGDNSRSESRERGDGREGAQFGGRGGGYSGRGGGGMNGFGRTNNFDDRQERDGQRYGNKFNSGRNSPLLGNPDAGVRRGGGRGGGRSGGRGGFQSTGNDFFGDGQRSNTNAQPNNFNTNDKPEKPQQNGFGNSPWEQPSQKTFHNSNGGFGGGRFSNNENGDGDAPPPSKVIVLNVGTEVTRQELNDLLNSKTPRLIDMNLQYNMTSNLNGPPTPKAYGYAEFPTVEDATKAIDLLKDVEFQGIKLKPMFSRKSTLNVNQTQAREHHKQRRNGDNVSVGSGNGSPSTNLSPTKSSPKKETTEEAETRPKTEEQQTKDEDKVEEKKGEEEVEKVEHEKVDEKAEEKGNGLANDATDEVKPKEGEEDVEKVEQHPKVDEKVDDEEEKKGNDDLVVGSNEEVKTTPKEEEETVVKEEANDENVVESKAEEKVENVDEKVEQQKVGDDEKKEEEKESDKVDDFGEVTTIQKEEDEQPQQQQEKEPEKEEDESTETEVEDADAGPPHY